VSRASVNISERPWQVVTHCHGGRGRGDPPSLNFSLLKNYLVGKCSYKNTKFGAGIFIMGNVGTKLKFWAPIISSVGRKFPAVCRKIATSSPQVFWPTTPLIGVSPLELLDQISTFFLPPFPLSFPPFYPLTLFIEQGVCRAPPLGSWAKPQPPSILGHSAPLWTAFSSQHFGRLCACKWMCFVDLSSEKYIQFN